MGLIQSFQNYLVKYGINASGDSKSLVYNNKEKFKEFLVSEDGSEYSTIFENITEDSYIDKIDNLDDEILSIYNELLQEGQDFDIFDDEDDLSEDNTEASDLIGSFKAYLKEQNIIEDEEKLDSTKSLIYDYFEQFKEFIKTEEGAKFLDGFNVEDLKDFQIVNGKFVASNDDSKNADFISMINDLMNQDSLKAIFDENSDGVIDEKDDTETIIENFLKVFNNDDDSNALTMDEVLSGLGEIKKADEKDLEKPVDAPDTTSGGAGGSSGTGGGGSGGSNVGSNDTSGVSNEVGYSELIKTTDKVNEAKNEKITSSEALSNFKFIGNNDSKASIESIKGINSEQKTKLTNAFELENGAKETANSKIADLQKVDESAAKAAMDYLAASEKVISLTENRDNIQAQVDILNQEVTNIEAKKTTAQTNATNLRAKANAINIPAATKNPDNSAEVEAAKAQKAALEGQASEQEQIVKEAQKELDEINSKLEEQNSLLETAKTDLDDANEELKTAKEAYDIQCEQKADIMQAVDDAIKDYNTKAQSFLNVKNEVQNEIKTAVNNDNKEIVKIQAENLSVFEQKIEEEKGTGPYTDYSIILNQAYDSDSEVSKFLNNDENKQTIISTFGSLDNYYRFLANTGFDLSSSDSDVKEFSKLFVNKDTYKNMEQMIKNKFANKNLAELTEQEYLGFLNEIFNSTSCSENEKLALRTLFRNEYLAKKNNSLKIRYDYPNPKIDKRMMEYLQTYIDNEDKMSSLRTNAPDIKVVMQKAMEEIYGLSAQQAEQIFKNAYQKDECAIAQLYGVNLTAVRAKFGADEAGFNEWCRVNIHSGARGDKFTTSGGINKVNDNWHPFLFMNYKEGSTYGTLSGNSVKDGTYHRVAGYDHNLYGETTKQGEYYIGSLYRYNELLPDLISFYSY